MVTLDHHLPAPAAAADLERVRDHERLLQWWSRLTAPARTEFMTHPDAPIAAEFLDEVLVGGVRVVGYLAGGQTMQWRFAHETRAFIAAQTGPGGLSPR